jgi:hypothetical protein
MIGVPLIGVPPACGLRVAERRGGKIGMFGMRGGMGETGGVR